MGDPIRLRERRSGASEELRELLVAGRSELPDAERLRAVAGRVGLPASAAPSGAELLAKTSGAGLGIAGAAKIGVLVLVLGAGAGVLSLRHRSPMAAASSATASVPAKVEAVVFPYPSVDAPEESSAPEPAKPPSAGVRARVPRTNAEARRMAARPAHVEVKATADVPAGGANPSIQPVDLGAPATWGSSTPVVAQAPIDAGASGSAAAAGDAGPLEEARRALANDPSRALHLALHDEETAGGLVEERDVIIIQALVRLGRLDEARARAARFLRVFPGSSHRSEIAAPFGFDPGRQSP